MRTTFDVDPDLFREVEKLMGAKSSKALNAAMAEYVAALQQEPGLVHWSAAQALDANLLSVSTTHAFGGAIAHRYAKTGSLESLSVSQVQTVLADEGLGLLAQEIAPANQAPAVGNAIVDQSASEDAAFSFAVAADAFSDPDAGDTLTYTAEEMPTWLSFDAGTQAFSGTPLQADVGASEVRVRANDVENLQIILDASDDFDSGSSDPLYNQKVQSFDFLGLVAEFDEALIASPGLTSWAVTNALLQFHLSGADDMALGGDLAYWYGKNGGLSGISLAAAQQVIGASGFGSDAQTLRPFSGLQEGFVKLA